MRQSEYATDVLFRTPAALQTLYPAWVHHAIEQFARYYRVSPKGHLVMTTALRFRDTDVALLAA